MAEPLDLAKAFRDIVPAAMGDPTMEEMFDVMTGTGGSVDRGGIPGQVKPPTGGAQQYGVDPTTGRIVPVDSFQQWAGPVAGFAGQTGTEGGTGPRVRDEAVMDYTGTIGDKWEGTFNPNLIRFGDLATNEVMEDIGRGTLRPGYPNYTPEVRDWAEAGGLGPTGTPPPPSVLPPTPGPASGPANGGGGGGGGTPTSTPMVTPNYDAMRLGGSSEQRMSDFMTAIPSLYESNLEYDPFAVYRRYRASQFPSATGAGMMGPALGYGVQPALGSYYLAGTQRPGTGTFAEYLRGPREDIGTTRSRFGSAADWLRGMGGEGMASLETMPMSAQNLYNVGTGLFDRSNIVSAGLAALGAGAGYSGQLGRTLGSVYDRMQDVYGAEGAGRFADYIQSAYQPPRANVESPYNTELYTSVPSGPGTTGRGL